MAYNNYEQYGTTYDTTVEITNRKRQFNYGNKNNGINLRNGKLLRDQISRDIA